MHALVLVIGEEDIDKAMAPFNEELYDWSEDGPSPRTIGAHWDWYTVGGRWDGCLLDMDGNWVSACKRNDLDYEGMCMAQRDEYPEALDASPWAPHSIIVDGEWLTWETNDYPNDWSDKEAVEAWHADQDRRRLEWCKTWLFHLRGVPRDALVTAVDFHS